MKVTLEFNVIDDQGNRSKVTKELCPYADKEELAKVLLEIDGYEEESLDTAINGWKYKRNLDNIWQEIFRPRDKHGYNRKEINELLGLNREDDLMTESQINCNKLMDLLEELYREVVYE